MFGKQASCFNQISRSNTGRMIESMAVDAYLCTASAYLQLLLLRGSLWMNIKYMLVSGAEVGENVC